MLLTVLTIQQVNNIVSDNFIKIFGNVIEHYPAAAISILKNRPFKNALELCLAFENYLDNLSVNEKENVLRLYPDLVEKLANLSIILEFEHRICGLDELTLKDKKKLRDLNKKYKEKFGFPFIIHSKKNTVSSIFTEMKTRVENEEDQEIALAIQEVKKIVKVRVYEILQG